MQIYLVPFTLLCLVLGSPVYGYITWFTLRRLMHKKRKFTGFFTWALIIQAAVSPLFWGLHFAGVFAFVEAPSGHFDPVSIAGHEFGFFVTYFLFTGILTILGLAIVKWKSV